MTQAPVGSSSFPSYMILYAVISVVLITFLANVKTLFPEFTGAGNSSGTIFVEEVPENDNIHIYNTKKELSENTKKKVLAAILDIKGVLRIDVKRYSVEVEIAKTYSWLDMNSKIFRAIETATGEGDNQ